MEPLEGEAFFDFDPKLAFLIIERLLGGKGGVYEVSRELTDIEYSVIESIINKFLLSFKEVWAPIIDLRPKFTFIESNPQFTQIVPPTDIVVLIQIEVTIGDTKGKIGVCIPYVVIEPVVSELSSQQRYSAGKKARAKEEIERVRQCMDLVNTEVVVELGRTEITMRDVLHLKVGDVVKLDNKASEDLIVKVGGVEKFYCRPGTSGSKMAVQINGQIKQFEKAS
jgi:flagellar motor switch protein FliM